MSTRAIYTFIDSAKDGGESFSIYKHHDGYVEGAAEALAKALPYAWPLPRFEASDFAAAFVAGVKREGGGSARISTGRESHGDLSFTYEITPSPTSPGELQVAAFQCQGFGKQTYLPIFLGTLDAFAHWATHPDDDARQA